MYQFWLNTLDADVIDRLKVFTFLSRADIEELAAQVEAEPFKREAQRRLAWEVTALVHGDAGADAVVAASAALFGNGDLFALDADTVVAAVGELPSADVSADTLVTQALVDTGLCASVSDARRAIAQGGVAINNEAVTAETDVVGNRTLAGGVSVLRRGKKTLAALKIT
jgi:tyrosyl-tRNA synthetase